MPKMSSIDATFHVPQDLICAKKNPSPTNPLAKIGNGHKEALRKLSEIFRKFTPPEIPLRVLVREVVQ